MSDHRAAVAAQSLLLRRAIEGTIRAEPALNARAAALSEAYRSGVEPDEGASHRHLQHPASAEAYAAARMPATFAAVARALGAAADRLPGFQPASLLDAGAGTGAASWAATAVWTSLVELTLVDREAAAIALGRRLATTAAAPGRVAGARWVIGDVDAELSPQSDLVVAAYLLGELPASEMDRAVARLWAATTGVLVLVEPGSRAGFERIRRARTALIEAGGTVAAPGWTAARSSDARRRRSDHGRTSRSATSRWLVRRCWPRRSRGSCSAGRASDRAWSSCACAWTGGSRRGRSAVATDRLGGRRATWHGAIRFRPTSSGPAAEASAIASDRAIRITHPSRLNSRIRGMPFDAQIERIQ